jgi:hypothetical protein
VKGKKGAGDDGAADNNGPVYKEIRPVKLDFSATNFKANVTGWRLSIEKKVDTLFPAVCDRARGIAGVAAASAATADSSEYQDPQILARANLESEEEDTDGGIGYTHEDTHRAHSGIDEDQFDGSEHHDNGLGVDDHHDNGVDDDREINEDDDGHHDSDNRGDNEIGGKDLDDEDNGSNSKASLSDGNDGVNGDGEFEEIDDGDKTEGSVLTDIGSSSDVS